MQNIIVSLLRQGINYINKYGKISLMLSLKKSPLIRTIALLSLGACQGSGQGNEGGPTTPNPQLPTPPPSAYAAPDIPTISTSDLFNTPEFKMNYGLQAMNTHTIYGQGISGE
jgi:hypothetical protein